MEIRAYLFFIQRRWKIILPLFLATLAVTVFLTLNTQPIYEASATYIVRINSASDEKNSISALNTLISSDDIPATYAKVANSRLIKRQAADQLGLSSSQRSNLASNSSLIAGTNIIEVTAKGNDPVIVMDYANEIGEQMLQYAATLYDTFELSPLDDATQPRRPVSPDIFTNLFLGAVLGLSLGLGMALVIEYWQNSLIPTNQSSPVAYSQSQLIGNTRFIAVVEKALSSAHITGEPVSVAMLALDSSQPNLFESSVKEGWLPILTNELLVSFQSNDRVSVFDDSIIAIFMPDTSETLAEAKVNDSISRLENISFLDDSAGQRKLKGLTGIASVHSEDESKSMTAQQIMDLAKERMNPNASQAASKRRSKQIPISTTT